MVFSSVLRVSLFVAFLSLFVFRTIVSHVLFDPLPFAFLALAVVFGEVAVLTQTFGVVQLVRVLTRPCFFCSANLMIAGHAHLLCVMAARVMRAAQNLVLLVLQVIVVILILVGMVLLDRIRFLYNRLGLIGLLNSHQVFLIALGLIGFKRCVSRLQLLKHLWGGRRVWLSLRRLLEVLVYAFARVHVHAELD